MQMRNKLAAAGGGWFAASKVNYILTTIHATLCLLVFLAQLIAREFYDKTILEISTVIQITCLVIPNIVFQICMKIFLKKACVGIQRFFDEKNQEIYTERGVNWLTCGTLVFIHLKIVGEDVEMEKLYGESSQLLVGTSGNNMNQNSNREVLLKKFHQANQGSKLMPKKV